MDDKELTILSEQQLKLAIKDLLKDEEIYRISDYFKIFGDSTRLKILWALNNNELCVGDLCKILNMTKSAISHQLQGLRAANLVKYRKVGKHVLYSLSDYHVRLIIETTREHLNEKVNS